MASFNKFIGVGNVVRDPELRYTPSAKALCVFGLAINHRSGSGATARDEVLFLDCEAWEKAAENISKFCRKGSPLLVEGRLRLDQWEDKTTKEKRSKIKCVVGSFQFMGRAPEGSEGTAGAPIHDAPRPSGGFATRLGTPPPAKPIVPPLTQEQLDEDVPF